MIFKFSISMIAAYILDIIVGDPYSLPHPVVGMGKMIGGLEKRARKKSGGNGKKLKREGLIIWLSVTLTGFLISMTVILAVSRAVFYISGKNTGAYDIAFIAVNSAVLYTCFSTKCLADEARKIYDTLMHDDIEASRKQLSFIVGRDTSSLSRDEIIRATVETVAENTVDGTMAPMFYAFIGTAPLAILYKAVNTMDSMLGYKNEKYRDIGYFPARLDDVFNFIPARISVIFFTLASMILGYDWKNSFRIAIRDRKNHTSPNCAFSEGAVAGALGIRLGGTNTYFGEKVYKPVIGDAGRKLEAEDIKRTNRILYMSTFINLIFYLAVYFLIGKFI